MHLVDQRGGGLLRAHPVVGQAGRAERAARLGSAHQDAGIAQHVDQLGAEPGRVRRLEPAAHAESRGGQRESGRPAMTALVSSTTLASCSGGQDAQRGRVQHLGAAALQGGDQVAGPAIRGDPDAKTQQLFRTEVRRAIGAPRIAGIGRRDARRSGPGHRASQADGPDTPAAWPSKVSGRSRPRDVRATARGAAPAGRMGPPAARRGPTRRGARGDRDAVHGDHHPRDRAVHLGGRAPQQSRNPVPQLPVRRARPGLRVQGMCAARHRRRDRRRPRARHPRLLGVDAVQGGVHPPRRRARRVRGGDPIGEHDRQHRRASEGLQHRLPRRGAAARLARRPVRPASSPFSAAVGWRRRSSRPCGTAVSGPAP